MSKNILLIPRIQIHNANALSSPFTIGFPAMTACLGFMHALERQLKNVSGFNDEDEDFAFVSLGVISHAFHLHTYRGQGDYVASIVGTGNPLDKSGNRPSFIEEARCDLTVSLLIECDAEDDENLVLHVTQLLQSSMKIAGGDIVKFQPLQYMSIDNNADTRQLMGKVMPGYCLIERRELMQQAMNDGQDAIDVLLDYVKLNHRSETNEQGDTTWHSHRKSKGWLVPIATGFQGITELGKAEHQRDADTPHRFAESIVTLGEFVMPYRINELDNMLWQYEYDEQNDLYLCKQKLSATE